MQQQETRNFSITWRGKKFTLEMNPDANLKLLGNELLKLTNVRDDTMRLIVPTNKSSKLLYPFSEEHSSLKLEETSILEGKSIRMLGVLKDEVDEVLQSAEADLRIVGFDEEEKRLRQRMSNGIRTSPKLPQGPYIFCDFRTLQLPGVELHPPASNALKLMHTLAADPGIVAIMNKHRWRVGIMTEMAPEGYVGVSPACILGFNKNHGEEISLRLRTDDLKGFRKYQRIKETLLHELAHMVHSEHDANFHALDKQLNEEAATLDWTKSKSHTLSGDRWLQHHEQDFDIDNSVGSSYKLGGKVPNFVNARASSVAAAYNRLAEASTNLPKASETHQESNSNDSQPASDQESKYIDAMQDCQLSGETVESVQNYNGTASADESSEDDRKFELDHDDTEVFSAMKPEPHADPDSADHYITSFIPPSETKLNKRPDDSSAERRNIEGLISLEPDPDEHGMETENEGISDRNGRVSLGYHVHEEEYEHHAYPKSNDVPEEIMLVEPDPDDKDVVSSRLIEEPDPDDEELRRIQDPVAVVCSRLQKAIGVLISETHPSEASRVLQTVLKIVRNAIEHPDEVKFRKLRKANPIIQKDVVSYQAAMEILIVIGFCEDVVMNEIGRTEAYLVLIRNDPGLLWLAKSSLETSIASFT